MTTLSVCVPVYNAASTIERCVESVLAQSYSDFECVVIDNCSTDDTVDRVLAFGDARIRLIRNAANVGMVGNHNRCAQVARGELIQFLHGDDWLLPDCLEKLVPAFGSASVGIAFARRRVVTTDREWLVKYGRLDQPLQPLGRLNDGHELVRRYLRAGAEGNPIGEPTSVMVRRETLVAAGGFRPEVPQLQDIDAWLRVLSISDAAFVDEELAVRWHHEGSATGQFARCATLDRMWVLSSVIGCAQVGWAPRAYAFGLWLRAFVRIFGAIACCPSDARRNLANDVATNVRYVLARHRIEFDRSVDG